MMVACRLVSRPAPGQPNWRAARSIRRSNRRNIPQRWASRKPSPAGIGQAEPDQRPARRLAVALQQQQEAEPQDRERDLGEKFERQVDEGRGRRRGRVRAMECQDARPDDVAADLRHGQQGVRRLADRARPDEDCPARRPDWRRRARHARAEAPSGMRCARLTGTIVQPAVIKSARNISTSWLTTRPTSSANPAPVAANTPRRSRFISQVPVRRRSRSPRCRGGAARSATAPSTSAASSSATR